VSSIDGRGRQTELDTGSIENLRAFFAILQAWDEEDRRETEQFSSSRHERAVRTIAGYLREDVESK
jgi:hypothetical protein